MNLTSFLIHIHSEHGRGNSGPVLLAHITVGRLICPLPLGGNAAVIAAQLCLNKMKTFFSHKSIMTNTDRDECVHW